MNEFIEACVCKNVVHVIMHFSKHPLAIDVQLGLHFERAVCCS